MSALKRSKSKKPKIVISRDELSKIMKDEPDRISFGKASKCDEYEDFKKILLDNDRAGYSICTKCGDNELVRHCPDYGTSGLIIHLDKYHNDNTPGSSKSVQTKMDSFSWKQFEKKDKASLSDLAALWCARDFRPFYAVEGQGFVDMIQEIIRIASIRGLVKAAELLPKADAVKDHLEKIDGKVRITMKAKLSKIDYVSCTTDHWLDSYNNVSYMSQTIHYFDQGSKKLNARIIGCFAVKDKTAAETKSQFDQKLEEFGLEGKLRAVVTDNASAMVSAFKDVEWIACSAHDLALVQKYSFGFVNDTKNQNPVPKVVKLIESAKEMVTFVKKSEINRDLDTRLKQEVETRWDTHYDMLKSVSDNFEELKKYPSLNDFMKYINQGLPNELVVLLKPLKDIRTELCSETNPSFHLVTVTFMKILDIMSDNTSDNDQIFLVKSRFRRYLKEKFKVTEYHLIATFLSPGYRSRYYNYNDKEKLKRSRNIMIALLEEIPESDDENEGTSNYTQKSNNSAFSDYMDTPFVPTQSDSEVTAYEALKFTADVIAMNPLDFWMTKRLEFPQLSRLALWLLAAPATSCSSERAFSAAGNTLTSLRSRLSTRTMDMIPFVRSNFDLLRTDTN